MRIIAVLNIILSFSLIILADIPVIDPEGRPSRKGGWENINNPSPTPAITPTPEEKKTEPQGTCFGVILLSMGIFLLGHRIIRKNEFKVLQTGESVS